MGMVNMSLVNGPLPYNICFFLSFLLYYTMDVYCVSNLSLSSMAYRVSLKSAPSTRFVLFLTILFSPLCTWTRYKFFDHSDIQHLEILSYVKPNGNDQVLWAKFLNILAVAQSDGSTLKVDQVSLLRSNM
jgi:hypothetical protein